MYTTGVTGVPGSQISLRFDPWRLTSHSSDTLLSNIKKYKLNPTVYSIMYTL